MKLTALSCGILRHTTAHLACKKPVSSKPVSNKSVANKSVVSKPVLSSGFASPKNSMPMSKFSESKLSDCFDSMTRSTSCLTPNAKTLFKTNAKTNAKNNAKSKSVIGILGILGCAYSANVLAQDTFDNPAYDTTINSVDAPPMAQSQDEDAQPQKEEQQQVQQNQQNQQIEDALIALKLKKAVEQGIIDDEVLAEYQKNTLAQNDTVLPTQDNSEAVDDDVTNNAINPATNVENATLTPTPAPTTDDISVLSPEQIEAALREAESDFEAAFDDIDTSSVATLDQTRQPLDFDATLQMQDKDISQVMVNQDMLDFSLPVDLGTGTGTGSEPRGASDGRNLQASGEGVQDAIIQNNDHDDDNDHVVQAQTAHNDLDASPSHAGNTEQNQSKQDVVALNPNDYLPSYLPDELSDSQARPSANQSVQQPTLQATNTNGSDMSASEVGLESNNSNNLETDDKKASVGFFKGLYNRVFNDGYGGFEKIDATVYVEKPSIASAQKQDATNAQPVLVKADSDVQPFANIKATLENITVEAISDFTVALPKLRNEALAAAKAVGYYDVRLRFVKNDADAVDVIIEQVGEPVLVASRIVDVRGEGASLPEFASIADIAPPRVGDVFQHTTYKQTVAAIEKQKKQLGFFEGEWLNRSADIILPDNTADVDLIYNTGERYEFGDVVFFTLNDAGQLTTDADKLPLEPEILHQLYDFAKGDPYYAPAITTLTNDLAATRYFNVANVETVEPALQSRATLTFDNQEAKAQDEQADATDQIAENSLSNSDDVNNQNGLNDQNELDGLAGLTDTESDADNDADNDIAPIEFSVDSQTSEKLQAIKEKAQRLSSLPDDRVLDEKEEKATNLLGRISDGISGLAQAILPDDPVLLSDTSKLPEDFVPPKLENKKTPQQVAQSKQVPVYVFVESSRPRDAQFGVGWGTDTGARAVARLEHNLINRLGTQAGLTIGVSKINKYLSLHASHPWHHPLDDVLVGSLTYEEELINQGEGNLDLSTNTLKAGIARNIRQDSMTYNDLRDSYDFTNGWNKTYSMRYRLDELESGVMPENRDDLPVPFNRKDAKFNQQALLFGYAIDKTLTDNVANPTRGFNQYYSLEGGVDGVGTDTNMAIAKVGANAVYSFGDLDKHQVIGSVDLGYIWSDNFEDVPYKIRFFAGGDRSIRGYDYQSLSPLENGYLVGGEVLAVASGEYNYAFTPSLRGAVFADVGNAYDTNFETDTKLGVGFGVRWASPVGMVRLDLAAGVLEDSIPVRLHFFIGSPLQ